MACRGHRVGRATVSVRKASIGWLESNLAKEHHVTASKKNTPDANDPFSKEVMGLEELLRSQSRRTEFWQAIELEGDMAPDIDNEMGWAEHGKFRLLYRRSKFDRNDELVSEKTVLLLDAPEAVRPQLKEFLPLFMEEFANFLESGEPNEESDDDEGLLDHDEEGEDGLLDDDHED